MKTLQMKRMEQMKFLAERELAIADGIARRAAVERERGCVGMAEWFEECAVSRREEAARLAAAAEVTN